MHNGHITMKRSCSLIAVPLLAFGFAACGSTVSTSNFKGEAHAVAQRISDLQADVTAANEQKLCSEDLSRAARARLNAATEARRHSPSTRIPGSTEARRHSPSTRIPGSTEARRHSPSTRIPGSTEARRHSPSTRIPGSASTCRQALKRQLGTIDSYELTVEKIAVNGATATAHVKSMWSGKLRSATLMLVKEGGSWRIAGTL